MGKVNAEVDSPCTVRFGRLSLFRVRDLIEQSARLKTLFMGDSTPSLVNITANDSVGSNNGCHVDFKLPLNWIKKGLMEYWDSIESELQAYGVDSNRDAYWWNTAAGRLAEVRPTKESEPYQTNPI